MYNLFIANNECHKDVEMFPESNNRTRNFNFKQGERLHQVTIGSSGADLYSLCDFHGTQGDFKYAQNRYYGYALVHITPSDMKIEFKKVDLPKSLARRTYEALSNLLHWFSWRRVVAAPWADKTLLSLNLSRDAGPQSLREVLLQYLRLNYF